MISKNGILHLDRIALLAPTYMTRMVDHVTIYEETIMRGSEKFLAKNLSNMNKSLDDGVHNY